MRINALYIPIIFVFLLNVPCNKIFAETQKISEVVIEKPERDVWIKKRYENKRLVEIIPYRWFNVKSKGARLEFHGNYKCFDRNGNIKKSRWYFRGQIVTVDEYSRLAQSVKLEPRLVVEETLLDIETKSFILKISLAWQKRDYGKCKEFIDKKLLEKPDWIPAVIANYGYWAFIDRDDEKAVAALASIEDLVKEIVKKPMEELNTRLWKSFLMIYYHYYEQSKLATGENIKIFLGRTIEIDNLHSTYVLFPPSDLMTAYLIASGMHVDMGKLRDAVIQEQKSKR